SSVSSLTTIASNDDVSSSDRTSLVTFTATAGITYYIAVDGYAGATGNITLHVAGAAASTGPANDNFANASVLSGSTASATGTNLGATKESGEPSHAGNSGGHSVWWNWTAPASGQATIDTSGSNF